MKSTLCPRPIQSGANRHQKTRTKQHDKTNTVRLHPPRRRGHTGGAQGIGRAVVARLLASGAQVAIWDVDPPEMARAIAALDDGDRLLTCLCNQSQWDSVQAAATATEAAFGKIDILVNNADIAGPTAPVASYDLAASGAR